MTRDNDYPSWCRTRSHDGDSTVNKGVAYPVGAMDGNSWFQPQVAGEIVLRSDGVGSVTLALVPGYPGVANMTGTGDMAATAALVISMIADIAGSGSMTAIIEGRLNASTDFTGSGTLNASMIGYANAIVDMLGVGDLDATVAALGNMQVSIVVTGAGVSNEGLAKAVWDALAAASNNAGTMGEKVNSTAGNAALIPATV